MEHRPHAVERLHFWVYGQAAGIFFTVFTYLYWNTLLPFLIWNLLAFIALAWLHRPLWSNGRWLGGLANQLTWLRFGMVLFVLFFCPALEHWEISSIAGGALILDGVDGWFARRQKLQSDYGEYFDKEVDAVFVMAMSLVIHYLELAGLWVLFFGLIRYLYLIPDYFLKPQTQKDPKTRYGRIIAGIVMGGLALVPALPPSLAGTTLPVLAILLGYSFGRSFLELLAERQA